LYGTIPRILVFSSFLAVSLETIDPFGILITYFLNKNYLKRNPASLKYGENPTLYKADRVLNRGINSIYIKREKDKIVGYIYMGILLFVLGYYIYFGNYYDISKILGIIPFASLPLCGLRIYLDFDSMFYKIRNAGMYYFLIENSHNNATDTLDIEKAFIEKDWNRAEAILVKLIKQGIVQADPPSDL
jgi:hypothetical protein